MMSKIFTCLLLVIISECYPASNPDPQIHSPYQVNKLEKVDVNAADKAFAGLRAKNEPKQFRGNNRQQLIENEKFSEERKKMYLDIFTKRVLTVVSEAIKYVTTQENRRRSSFYNNLADQSSKITKEMQQTYIRNPVKKCHSKKSLRAYVSPEREFTDNEFKDYRRIATPEAEDDDLPEYDDSPAPSRRLLAMLTSFMTPILGVSGNSASIEKQGELAGLEKARQELQAAQQVREQQKQFKVEKLEREAEVNRLKMEFNLLKMQREMEHAREKELVSKINEERFKKLREEMSQKMHHELRISKIHQGNSNLVNKYQINKKVIDRTVYQPIIENLPAITDGYLAKELPSSNDLEYQNFVNVGAEMEDSLPYCDDG